MHTKLVEKFTIQYITPEFESGAQSVCRIPDFSGHNSSTYMNIVHKSIFNLFVSFTNFITDNDLAAIYGRTWYYAATIPRTFLLK